jgi:ribonuclease VapC
MRYVADSSALLAALNNEPGGDRVRDHLSDMLISAVNLAEVVTKLVERGVRHEFIDRWIESTPLSVVAHDCEQAVATGKLRSATRDKGLSLGDRACLALAIAEDVPAITADQAWRGLESLAEIEFIR